VDAPRGRECTPAPSAVDPIASMRSGAGLRSSAATLPPDMLAAGAFGPKHLALYAVILVVVVLAAVWAMRARSRGSL